MEKRGVAMPPNGSAIAGPGAAAGTRRRDARSRAVKGRAPWIAQTPIGLNGDAATTSSGDHHCNTVVSSRPRRLRIMNELKRDVMAAGVTACVILLVTSTVTKVRSTSPTSMAQESSRTSSFVSGRGVADLRTLGYRSKPRTMGCYFLGVEDESILKDTPRALYTYYERYPSKRQMHVSERAVEAQKRLQKSRHYRRGRAEPFETQECKAQYEWQLALRPTCNEIHQIDINDLRAKNESEEKARILASGYWRDTWVVRDHVQREMALKTMRYEHEFEERNFARHRRDALASERLSSSAGVVDIFSFCGNTGVYEFISGGDINDAIWPLEDSHSNSTVSSTALTKIQRLDIALQVTAAITDMHNVDLEGRPSIAHTDITPSQFLLTAEGKWKLTDFNRVRFLRKNITAESVPCSYIVGRNPGKFRSPEEYSHTEQTSAIDVYSMGNIFYSLLTEYWPFEGMAEKEAQRKIMDGARPPIDDDIRISGDPIDSTFIEAIGMCWRQNPDKRATAKEVQEYLISQIESIGNDTK